MKCSEIVPKLPAYQAGEVTASERVLIQSHLANCASCRIEIDTVNALQNRIRASLLTQAAESAPSPQAWSRLQARLEPTAGASWPHSKKQPQRIGVFKMKSFTFVTLSIIILLAATFAFVPGVRAAVLENVLGWLGYDFTSPNSDAILSLSTNWGFAPYNPHYMPAGLEIKGTMVDGGQVVDTLALCYQPDVRKGGDPFIAIIQESQAAEKSLPSGKEVSILGIPGVIDELPAGEIRWCLGPTRLMDPVVVPTGQEPPPPEQMPPSEPLTYEQALRLTYFAGNIRIEIFGPYTQKELVRIAKSMQQANLAAFQPTAPAP